MSFASIITIATALVFAFGFVAYNSRFVLKALEFNSYKLIQTNDWLLNRHKALIDVDLEELELDQ